MSELKLLFMMRPEQLEVFLRLQQAAERGDGDAACRLGDMYREGLGGLRYSPKQTYQWYAKSALAGDANGQNNLGACYEHGLGCAQSYAKAVKWYRLAVAQELATAVMNLGYCYLRGHGVPADKEEALRLFRLAVEGGEERAQQEVERLECQAGPRVSKPVAADTPQVLPWRLGSRVPPRDGPLQQLRHPETGPAEDVASARPIITRDGNEPAATAWTGGSVEFVDETQPRRHLGLVGGVTSSPPPWEDENVRRELVDILATDTVSAADSADGPTEDKLFPIFADGKLKPEDLVDGVAERYAEYLKGRESRRE
jgi:hypothetical protein